MSLYAESSAVLAWLLDDAVGSRVNPFERSTLSIWPRRSSRKRSAVAGLALLSLDERIRRVARTVVSAFTPQSPASS